MKPISEVGMIEAELEKLVRKMIQAQSLDPERTYEEVVDSHSTGIIMKLRRFAMQDLQEALGYMIQLDNASNGIEYEVHKCSLRKFEKMWRTGNV